MATGGENGKIQRLSTFLSNELTNKTKKRLYKIETNFFLHCGVWPQRGLCGRPVDYWSSSVKTKRRGGN